MSPDSHMVFTSLSHDTYITIILIPRDSSTSCLWCKWLPIMRGQFLLPTSPLISVSGDIREVEREW